MIIKNQNQIIKNGKTPEIKKIRQDILNILEYAIKSVNPYNLVKSKIKNKKLILNSKIFDFNKFDNIFLIGFGKSSVGMTQALCDTIKIKKGIIITNDKLHKVKNNEILTLIGNHPIPTKINIDNTEKLLKILKNCKENDLLIVLISGGGSALFCKPKIEINDLKKTTNLLLKSGANIKEINTIRKHLSYVKAGLLAKQTKCTLLSLIISDVINDPIEYIASGPTYPDSTTYQDAKNILIKYNIWTKLPNSVKKIITEGVSRKIPETPKKEDLIFKKVFNYIVGNNEVALRAAQEKAKKIGYKTLILSNKIEGESREIGEFLTKKVIQYKKSSKKIIFISSGEPTVTLKGKGKGGRNQEMILSSIKLLKNENIVFSSIATDGIDGNSDAAGAIADKFSYFKAGDKNLKIESFLEDNNSYEFFKNLNDLLYTGVTGTNVMDLQILIKY